jgi:hypothetical protein
MPPRITTSKGDGCEATRLGAVTIEAIARSRMDAALAVRMGDYTRGTAYIRLFEDAA